MDSCSKHNTWIDIIYKSMERPSWYDGSLVTCRKALAADPGV